MKYLLLLFFSGYCICGVAQNKYALIIANTDYDKYNKGWVHLSSDNDTTLIIDALTNQGFNRANIAVVRNATRHDFEVAFKKYLLDKVHQGDDAYFHYSGHGQQVADDNGDEDDGYDEALVGIDAPLSPKYDSLYKGEKHIRDDELGTYLDSLREKLGSAGNVLVTIDACESGTISRGAIHSIPHTRGTDLKWEFPDAVKKPNSGSNNDDGFSGNSKNSSLADLVVISASSQNQYDSEHPYENCGSLTYAFNAAFSKAEKGTTYGTLYNNIKNLMAEFPVSNVPQYDGNGSKEIFGNKIKGATVYYKVLEVYKKQQVMLNSGEVNGIYRGTEFAIYKKTVESAKDTISSNLLATGIVDSASWDAAMAHITTVGKINDTLLKGAHVFITKLSFAGLTTRISVQGKELKQEIDSVIKSNTQTSAIAINDNAYNLVVKPGKRLNEVDLTDRTDKLLAESISIDSLFYRLVEYGRVNLLLNLSNRKIPEVTFKMVKADSCHRSNKKIICHYTSLSDSIDKSQCYHVKVNDWVTFGMLDDLPYYDNNRSFLHYLLFEISPLNQIAMIFPKHDDDGNYDFSSCQIKNRDTLNYNATVWHITEPYGIYRLRLLLSQPEFDENSILDLYSYSGIRKEADRYLKNKTGSRGKEKLKNPQDGNIKLQEEESGVIDLFYEAE